VFPLWGWVPATGSDLPSGSYSVSIDFSGSLLEKILEADHFGAGEEMPLRYCQQGRSKIWVGGRGRLMVRQWQED